MRRVRAETAKPLVVKLSPALPDPARTAAAAADAGADGFTAVNTLPAQLYDEAGRSRLGAGSGGLSGPPLLPVGLKVTRAVASRTGKPVIGVGGVRTGADALQYLAAGRVPGRPWARRRSPIRGRRSASPASWPRCWRGGARAPCAT